MNGNLEPRMMRTPRTSLTLLPLALSVALGCPSEQDPAGSDESTGEATTESTGSSTGEEPVELSTGSTTGSTTEPATGSTTEPVAEQDPLELYDGYWRLEFEQAGNTIVAVNDLLADLETRRATVYAQTSVGGVVAAPPQVGPGECTEDASGQTVCFHPNAVYLNAPGVEADTADGSGSWWVKHSWVLGGEGYDNCELGAAETYPCYWAEGVFEEDGLTMRGTTNDRDLPLQPYNRRVVHVEEDPIRYTVERYLPTIDPDTGMILDPRISFQSEATFECAQEASAFDGQVRPCSVKLGAVASVVERSDENGIGPSEQHGVVDDAPGGSLGMAITPVLVHLLGPGPPSCVG